MMSNVFAIAVAAFAMSGFAWGYFAVRAIRAKQWGLALLRAIAALVSFGGVVFEFMLMGALLY